MASSGSDDDFRSRAEKIFGSLAFSRSSSSSTPASRNPTGSFWSVSTEMEKREWKRDPLTSYDRDEMPCASSFDELLRQQRTSGTAAESFQDDIEDLDDGGDDVKGDFDDEWSIRASMGLDRTLDDEEEEDAYDKLALGKVDTDESFMKGVLSKQSGGRSRDPRANHHAAKIRLKEDEVEAKKLSTCDNHPSKSKESYSESSKVVPPKPILKRKENSSEAKSSKRVRFDVVSEENVEDTSKKPTDSSEDISSSDASASKTVSHMGKKAGPQVPDYLINPSKYTRYSFDSSNDSNENSPTGEYIDIPKTVEGSKTSDSGSSGGSSEKVAFIPQKKTKPVTEDSNSSETKEVSEETTKPGAETTRIVAGQIVEDDEPEDGNTEMEELESCTSVQRTGRQYRTKRSLD